MLSGKAKETRKNRTNAAPTHRTPVRADAHNASRHPFSGMRFPGIFLPHCYGGVVRRSKKQFDAVVIVASVGGVAATGAILSQLPAAFPIPILLVQHRSSEQPNYLAQVLQRSTELKVKRAAEGDELVPGVVYVAPPTRHLVVTKKHTLGFLNGETRIKRVLSAGDPLFTTAAEVFGNGVVAVVLTGMDSNGSKGVVQVKQSGGVVLAQDRATSEWFQMPEAAIATGCVDKVLPIREIGTELMRLAITGHNHAPPPLAGINASSPS